jgi:hypothetical protein
MGLEFSSFLVGPNGDSQNLEGKARMSKDHDNLSKGTRDHTRSPSPQNLPGLAMDNPRSSLERINSNYDMGKNFLKNKRSSVITSSLHSIMNRPSARVNPSIGSAKAGGWEIPKTKMAIERDTPNQGFTVKVQLKQDTLDVEKKTPVKAKKNSVWRIENGVMKEIFPDADNLPMGGRKMKKNDSSWGKFGYDGANDWKPPSKGPGPDSVAKILSKTRESRRIKGSKHNPFQSSVFRSMKG